MSAAVRCNEWEVVRGGDVVMLQHGVDDVLAGRVMVNFATTADATPMTIMHRWEFISEAARSSKWRVQEEPLLCHSSYILWACIYSERDGVAELLHSRLLRELRR